MPHRLMQMKMINLQRAEFKDTPEIKVKQLCSRLVHYLKFHCSNSEWYSVVSMAPTCLYVCLTTSGHAPNETMDSVLEYLLPDLDQGTTEHLDSLRCNLAASDRPKHNVPEVFYWI